MSTIIELADQQAVVRFDATLSRSQFALRRIYLMPRVVTWFQTTLPGLQSDWRVEVQPDQQLDDFLTVYVAGEPLTFDRQIKPLNHLGQGVWEMKTPDTRLFGWFVDRDCFVCSAIDIATRVKQLNLYPGYSGQAVTDRNTLGLNLPCYIASTDPNDVISNLSFP